MWLSVSSLFFHPSLSVDPRHTGRDRDWGLGLDTCCCWPPVVFLCLHQQSKSQNTGHGPDPPTSQLSQQQEVCRSMTLQTKKQEHYNVNHFDLIHRAFCLQQIICSGKQKGEQNVFFFVHAVYLLPCMCVQSLNTVHTVHIGILKKKNTSRNPNKCSSWSCTFIWAVFRSSCT